MGGGKDKREECKSAKRRGNQGSSTARPTYTVGTRSRKIDLGVVQRCTECRHEVGRSTDGFADSDCRVFLGWR